MIARPVTLIGERAFTAWTLLVHGAASHVTNSTTGDLDTTGARLIVWNCNRYTGSGTGFAARADNKSNPYTELAVGTTGEPDQQSLLYCEWPTAGAGHHWTLTAGSALAFSQQVAAFGGGAAGVMFDRQNRSVAAGATTIQAGSLTPSRGGCLIIAACLIGNNGDVGGITIDSGFTILDTTNHQSGDHLGGSLAYKIKSAADVAAENPTWNFVNSTDFLAAQIASFRSGV